MVLSKINDKITYNESKKIDENDKGRDVTMYQINLFKIPVVIALGEVKYTHVKENILFTPVYLVVDDINKIYQIGVYEFNSDDLENIKDDDGDIDISIIDGPLLYSFINKFYIKKCMKNEKLLPDYDSGDEETDDGEKSQEEDDDELEDVSSDEEEADDEGEEKNNEKEKKGELQELTIEEDDDDFSLKGETKRDDSREIRRYNEDKPPDGPDQWIKRYMSNNSYGIKDNPGGGDCFFYVIRDAFKEINQDASVKILRDKLSDSVTDEVFNNYMERFKMFDNEVKSFKKNKSKLDKEKKELAKEYNSMVKNIKAEKDFKTRSKLKQDAKILKAKHIETKQNIELLLREQEEAKINIKTVNWVKNLKSKEQMQKKVKTSDYWADIWGISTLEILLNIKCIILSSDEYNRGKYERVTKCGDFVSNEIERKKYFKPKYYIIFEHTGNHYKLILYKDKSIFRFHELPFGLKEKIVETCMKSTGKSLYNYIPKFAKLIGENIEIPEIEEQKVNDDKIENDEDGVEKKETEDIEELEMIPTPSPNDKDLFDSSTEFVFYSGSKDSKPGKGSNEKIKEGEEYKELESIPNWRKVLSNFYTKPMVNGVRPPLFELDGKKWASVEHYYHANKFKKNNKDYYDQFALGSGSLWENDALKALGAGGKGGRVKEKVPGRKTPKVVFKRPKEILMDNDFESGTNKQDVMERGQQAKYEQDDFCRRVLLATKNAKLSHFIPRRKKGENLIPFYDTMRVRQKLQKEN